MFLDITAADGGNYFVNLAQIDSMGLGHDPFESAVNEPGWMIWIWLEGDPIPLRKGFYSEEHATAFKHAVLRRACTTGLVVDADLEELFESTRPADG